MTSQALTLYRPSSITKNSTRSFNLSRVFTAETGTHLATELLYRILIAIFQRFFNAFEDFATRRLDQFATYLEKSKEERKMGPGIVQQLAAKEEENEDFHPICPMTGKRLEPPTWARKRMEAGRHPPGPPAWAKKLARNWRKGTTSKVTAREGDLVGYGHTFSFE